MGYQILTQIPAGWKEMKNTTIHPYGGKWYNNGKSRFSKEYQYALVIPKKQQKQS